MPFSCTLAPSVTDSDATHRSRRPHIARLYRLQWEEAQQAFVLLFPEGMVKLNGSAGEILRRCNGKQSTSEIIGELEIAFSTTGLGSDVDGFLRYATEKGWVEWSDT
jgi:pyrroloquinoline quinone biosynthesis protein D